jgi:hypothetical protein
MAAGTIIEIPVIPSRAQSFRITLNNNDYLFALNWNRMSNCWILNISDPTSGEKILMGIPLVTGADLLEQFPYETIGENGYLLVYTAAIGTPPDSVPTFDNLGVEGRLFYISKK